MIKVGLPYKPQGEQDGLYLLISTNKPYPSEVVNYGAKRVYYVHAVTDYTSIFIGRFFKLNKAREAAKNYRMI